MTIQKPFAVVPLDLGTITTGNQAAAYPVTNIGRFKDVGMVWQSVGNGNLWILCDLGAAREIDFISLMNANALSGTNIRIRLGDTRAEVEGVADYDSATLAFVDPAITRENGLYHSHHEIPFLQIKRWLRIDIGGHTGDFFASMLVIGKKLTPSRFYNRDFEYGVEDLGNVEITRWGVADEQDGLVFRTLKFTLGWQTESEYQTMFRPMTERLGRRGIVYWCFDPEPTTYRQAKTYLGRMNQTPAATGGIKPGTFAQEFSILSIL